MLSDPETWASLLTLTLLEVVLSVDNIVVIAVLVASSRRSSEPALAISE